jgi:NAD(P)H dehydrogenase (quinone)
MVLLAAAAQAAPPVRILVVYHSQTGNTEKLAQAVGDGAASVPGVEVALRKAAEATAEEIAQADGLAIGTPVHWGNLSAETKAFLDRAGVALGSGKPKPMLGEGKVAGVFCTAGAAAGGQDTARTSVIAALLHMRFVITGGVSADGYGTLGPQAVTGGSPPGVGEGDRADARRFGERLARLAKQLHSGAGK